MARPDLAHTAAVLSPHGKNASQVAVVNLDQAVRYGFCTQSYSMKYPGPGDPAHKTDARVVIHCDASHDSPSTVGVLVTHGDNYVMASSKRLKTPTFSAAESEMMAMCYAAQTAKYIQLCQSDMGLERRPIDIFCDNKSAVYAAKSNGVRRASRHYLDAQRYVQQMRNDGIIEVHHVPAEQQQADFLTKHLSGPKLKKIMSTIMNVN